jgi:hypothetical protein
MSETTKPPLRPAMIFKREGKRPNQGRWLECGGGRVEKDGSVNIYLDRIPIGGWSGRVFMAGPDGKPPEEKPARPGDDDVDDAADE